MPAFVHRAHIWRLTFLIACFFSSAILAGCKGPNLTPDPAYADASVSDTSLEQEVQKASATVSTTSDATVGPVQDPTQPPHHRTWRVAIKEAFTKPWYGNYLGPSNYGYDKKPVDALDAAAREHDLAYDRCKADGIVGALCNLEAGKADLHLARQAFLAVGALDFPGKLMGIGTGLAMGALGIIKEPFAELRDALHRRSPPPAPSPASLQAE